MLTLKEFKEARGVLSGVIRNTSLVYSPAFSKATGNQIYIKPENMQVTGAYKIRGAYYKISTLSDEEKARGLVTASAGNHAQGVACAAQRLNTKAVIVMPTNANPVKLAGVKAFGGEVELVGTLSSQREARAQQLVEEAGMVNVTPMPIPTWRRARAPSAWKFWRTCPKRRLWSVPSEAAVSSLEWLLP